MNISDRAQAIEPWAVLTVSTAWIAASVQLVSKSHAKLSLSVSSVSQRLPSLRAPRP